MLIPINIRIKKILAEKGLNVSKLAAMIGTSKQNLNRILDNEDFRVSLLLKILEAINVEPGEFFKSHQNDYYVSEPEPIYKVNNRNDLLFLLRKEIDDLKKRVASLEKLVKC